MRKTRLVTYIAIAVLSLPALGASCAHEFFRPYYKSRSEFCRTGELVTDFYTGKKLRCEEAEVDHVVSLREAYLQGVCGDDLKNLAKDPDNLRLTHWTLNRRKGAMPVENFVSQNQFSDDVKTLNVAKKIRVKYGVLSGEDAFSMRVASYFSRSKIGTKILPIMAVRSMKGVTEKQVGKKILLFSGKRVIGFIPGVSLATGTAMLFSDGYIALGRSLSTDDEVRRAELIEELLK